MTAAPFVAIFVAVAVTEGLWAAVLIFGAVAGLVAWLSAGISLLCRTPSRPHTMTMGEAMVQPSEPWPMGPERSTSTATPTREEG